MANTGLPLATTSPSFSGRPGRCLPAPASFRTASELVDVSAPIAAAPGAGGRMSVYIMNAGASPESVDAVEAQMRPAIPGLKRIETVDSIGKPSLNGGGRPFVILVIG